MARQTGLQRTFLLWSRLRRSQPTGDSAALTWLQRPNYGSANNLVESYAMDGQSDPDQRLQNVWEDAGLLRKDHLCDCLCILQADSVLAAEQCGVGQLALAECCARGGSSVPAHGKHTGLLRAACIWFYILHVYFNTMPCDTGIVAVAYTFVAHDVGVLLDPTTVCIVNNSLICTSFGLPRCSSPASLTTA